MRTIQMLAVFRCLVLTKSVLRSISNMVKKHLQAKSKHHHVWADYLKRWSLNDRDVYYTTAKGNIVCESVRGLTMEKDFYQVKSLSDENVEVIKGVSAKSPDSLQKHHASYLNDFLYIQKLEEMYKKRGKKNEEVEKFFHASRCNMLEDLHSAHENEVQEIINSLANRDLSKLTDTKNLILFMQFFGHQISRTKTFKDTVVAGVSRSHSDTSINIPNNMKECWWFLSYMFGMNIGAELYLAREKDIHCLLINTTSIPFITSDQPIINVHKSIDRDKIEPPGDDDCDFYYPISPEVAYMINRSDRFQKGINHVSIDFVKEVNDKIARRANVNIISNCKDTLKHLLPSIGFHLNMVNSQRKQ